MSGESNDNVFPFPRQRFDVDGEPLLDDEDNQAEEGSSPDDEIQRAVDRHPASRNRPNPEE